MKQLEYRSRGGQLFHYCGVTSRWRVNCSKGKAGNCGSQSRLVLCKLVSIYSFGKQIGEKCESTPHHEVVVAVFLSK